MKQYLNSFQLKVVESFNSKGFSSIPENYSPKKLQGILKSKFNSDKEWSLKEYAYLIYFNKEEDFVNISILSVGNSNRVFLDYSMIFKKLFIAKATHFIICHNHPQGNCKPSLMDIKTSISLFEVSTILHLDFLDFLIVSDSSYFSFQEKKLI